MRSFGKVLGLITVTMLASASLSYGATIYVCRSRSDGAIRVVGAMATCRDTETRMSWNSVGPQGPKGDPGPTGPQGPSGPGPQRFRIVGRTTQLFGTTEGPLYVEAMRACYSEFAGSRIARTLDFFQQVNPSSESPDTFVWIMSTPPFSAVSSIFYDSAGVAFTSPPQPGGYVGTRLDLGTGRVTVGGTLTNQYPILCSVPE